MSPIRALPLALIVLTAAACQQNSEPEAAPADADTAEIAAAPLTEEQAAAEAAAAVAATEGQPEQPVAPSPAPPAKATEPEVTIQPIGKVEQVPAT